ncbi:MAG: hypothetical protein OEL79_11330 [Chromatiales bacterium]|nr:hypothetical protein [Chromatiales bacterium]
MCEDIEEMIKAYLEDTGQFIYGNFVSVEQIHAGNIVITDQSKDGHYKDTIHVNTLDVLAWMFKKFKAD